MTPTVPVAGPNKGCAVLRVGLTTLKRWRRQFAAGEDGINRRKGSKHRVTHRLREEERQRILLSCNQPDYVSLSPRQIVAVLADRIPYNSCGKDFVYGPEPSYCLVLHAYGQAHRRGRARLPMKPRRVPRLRADGPHQVWSREIFYLPISAIGIWRYLYLFIDL